MNAFVTGGSRGIGRAIVLRFAAAGYGVAFTYEKNAAAAEETVAAAKEKNPDVTVTAHRMPLQDKAAIEAVTEEVIDTFEEVPIVVNNAGIVRDNAAVLMTDEQWEEVIGVNLSGPFYVTRAFLMHMLPLRMGRLIYISSLSADGSSGQINYAASKAGLVGLARTVAKEYGTKGITANVVTVGYVPTEMTKESFSPMLEKFWLQNCPAHRAGTVEEVAGTVHFLTTPEAAMVSGETIRVAGGLTYAP